MHIKTVGAIRAAEAIAGLKGLLEHVLTGKIGTYAGTARQMHTADCAAGAAADGGRLQQSAGGPAAYS